MPPESPKRVLLLQGPMGPFFRRFANELRSHGIEATKVNFNAGDALYFYGDDAISFRNPMDEWPAFFRKLVEDRDIDAIFLFGDCRPIHKQAIQIAKKKGIAVWVFEEGYLRPDHITIERDGVNGNSSLSKDPSFYHDKTSRLESPPEDLPVGRTFPQMAWHSAVYVIGMSAGTWAFPHYRHHRDLRPMAQAGYWLRSFWRKKAFALRERGVLDKAAGAWSGDYYLVPLQVHCDFQIEHSDYESIPAFIEEVVESFAHNAPAGTKLVLKHHPQDRAYRDYTELLQRLGTRHGISHRLRYIHDQHLPTLLKHARGVITMNSTVGTSALFHKTPVIVLGRAIYDIPGLTFAGGLEDFFKDCGSVDADLYAAFNRWLREANQINGSFYKETGLRPEAAVYHLVRQYVESESEPEAGGTITPLFP